MRLALGIVLPLLLAACAQEGRMEGTVLNAAGRAEGVAQFSWEQEAFEAAPRVFVLLPDGEAFRGTAVIESRTEVTRPAFGPSLSFGFSSGGRHRGGKGYGYGYGSAPYGYGPAVSTIRTGRISAQLIGDRGRVMACALTAASPETGLSGGGHGGCTLSDETRIAVRF